MQLWDHVEIFVFKFLIKQVSSLTPYSSEQQKDLDFNSTIKVLLQFLLLTEHNPGKDKRREGRNPLLFFVNDYIVKYI